MFFTDSKNNRVREVLAPVGGATTGIITTVAGNGTAAEAGDSGPAISASFNGLKGIDLTNAGDLVVADTVNQIPSRDSAIGELCGDRCWFHADANGLRAGEYTTHLWQLWCAFELNGFQRGESYWLRCRNAGSSSNHLLRGNDFSTDSSRQAERVADLPGQQRQYDFRVAYRRGHCSCGGVASRVNVDGRGHRHCRELR